MRYLKMLFIAALLLVGCSAPKENEPVKVLAPTGAPALALVEQASIESENTIDFVNGPDNLGAELVKDNYDIIFAPVNLGTKMIQAGKSVYRLEAVITWGNLYLVGTSENALSEEGNFYTFGEGSVVDFVLKNAIDLEKITPTVNAPLANAQEVQAMFLSNKATVGMLAEPAVTATIKKAKEKGIDLQVIMNLQEEYQKTMGTELTGFPQAAIFVKEGSEEKAAEFLSSVETWVNETAVNTPEKIEEFVDTVGADTLGVPSAALSKATWAKQNIHYVDASTCTKDLTTLLSLMNIEYSEEMLSK